MAVTLVDPIFLVGSWRGMSVAVGLLLKLLGWGWLLKHN